MRNFISLVLILFCTLGLIVTDAHAKRFGGGRSFGMQRSVNSFSRMQRIQPPVQQPRSSASRWLGPLAGLAAGGLLASLFMGHGVGGAMLSWLMVGGIVLLLFNLLRSRKQSFAQPMQYYNSAENTARDTSSYFGGGNQYSSSSNSSVYPADFDSSSFLRDAKAQFIRLQTAYDQKNLNDIRKFTAPEIFAEIQLQLQEMGEQTNQTDVVSLEAELLDVGSELQATVASVRFTGMIREEAGAAPVALNEVWHFQKDLANVNWIVTGLQQA